MAGRRKEPSPGSPGPPEFSEVDVDVDGKLFLGNLNYRATEADLFRVFRPCGPICEVFIIKDDQGKPRGIGFVQFQEAESALRAMNELNGYNLQGYQVQVRPAFPRPGQSKQYRAPNPLGLDAYFGWDGQQVGRAEDVRTPGKPSDPEPAQKVLKGSTHLARDLKRKFDYPVYAGPSLPSASAE
jgi:RNA recognition motif-containing protein